MEDYNKKMFLAKKISDLSEEEREFIKNLYHDKKLNEEEKRQYWNLLYGDEKLLKAPRKLTKEEESYRRGYVHGFFAENRYKTTTKQVLEWRYGDDDVGAPGSSGEGVKISGC